MVWDGHGNTNAPTILLIPIRELVTVVGQPFCENSRVWVQIGYQGRVGYAVEVTIINQYNLIPNGQELPGNQSQPAANPSVVTNANGKILARNSDGDLVYPIAYGSAQRPASGQYAYVATQYDGMLLRSSPDDAGNRRDNIIATLQPNQFYLVLQIGTGFDQIQTSEGPGWSTAKYLQILGQAVVPTQAPYGPVTSDKPSQSADPEPDNCERNCPPVSINGYPIPQNQFPSSILLAVCPLNPWVYEYYKDPTNVTLGAMMPSAPSKFLDIFSNLLNLAKIGIDAAKAVKDPIANTVTLLVWQRTRDGIFYYQLLRQQDGKFLSFETQNTMPPFQNLGGILQCTYSRGIVA